MFLWRDILHIRSTNQVPIEKSGYARVGTAGLTECFAREKVHTFILRHQMLPIPFFGEKRVS